MQSVAKIFMNGNSQVVYLPTNIRFDSDEIFVREEGDSVVLYPKPKRTWRDFFENFEAHPDFKLERDDNNAPQERVFFR